MLLEIVLSLLPVGLMQTYQSISVGYWSARMNAGQVIAFGPVGDPAGPWGFGLVRARDLADVQAFGAADPAIKAEQGFRYEYLPMINLILPQ